ncbi:methyltransferase domain-containing protein [Nonomuraea sp. NPDC049784]|uniref:SAM-dependent methyltransferase n=1 Tax=Nonomuraea sp. NPDC049784 TaxID=3154361 RepID=UPI0033EC847C
MDIPRSFVIRESSHRILNPFTLEKFATLGAAIGLRPDASVLDLCCGKGEMLATWARDHGIAGTGVDISTDSLATARERAAEFGVADRLTFVHGDGRVRAHEALTNPIPALCPAGPGRPGAGQPSFPRPPGCPGWIHS